MALSKKKKKALGIIAGVAVAAGVLATVAKEKGWKLPTV